MATISFTLLEHSNNDANQNSYITGSVSPGANYLILVTVLSRASSGTTNIPTLTGNGLTYVQVATKITSDNTNRITIFRAMGSAPTAGAITIDFAIQTQLYCHWDVTHVTPVDTSGTNGSGAVLQSATASDETTNTTLLITLAAFASANNAAYGSFRAGNTVTPGSGFTELGETSGETIMQSEYKINDNTVDASWASTSSFAIGIALEVSYADPVATTNYLKRARNRLNMNGFSLG